jgi:glutamyl-Q tRNA(Asp) synthetase
MVATFCSVLYSRGTQYALASGGEYSTGTSQDVSKTRQIEPRVLSQKTYRGRFAPSPTGPLHFGSLLAAIGSYIDARAHGGEWLVRIEDLDPPREIPGAADDILRVLDSCGLHWDGDILYQSRRLAVYENALEALRSQERVFPCGCTRKEIADSILGPNPSGIYPGNCREGLAQGKAVRSQRLRVGEGRIDFVDAVQGAVGQDLSAEVGDFVLKRADGWHAYQLAVVVDDAFQGITDVVRGADLLHSTPRQMLLQRLLGLSTPRYMHLPVAVDRSGTKLSKQTLAPAITENTVGSEVFKSLVALNQRPPDALSGAPGIELIAWGIAHWDRNLIGKSPISV